MCNACITLLNDAKPVETFADQLMNMLNQGALSMMVSISHRTGQFDGMAELKETTVEKITNQTGLEKRINYHKVMRFFLPAVCFRITLPCICNISAYWSRLKIALSNLPFREGV